jgi:hypothetical protein
VSEERKVGGGWLREGDKMGPTRTELGWLFLCRFFCFVSSGTFCNTAKAMRERNSNMGTNLNNFS